MAYQTRMETDRDENVPSKRFRRDDPNVDPTNPDPSVVVHVRNLSPRASEADLLEALSVFGPIAYVTCKPNKKMALVEFEALDGAQNCVNFAASKPINVAGLSALFNYSTSQMIQRLGLESETPKNVLTVTVYNVQHPITCEVINQVCSPHGTVRRIAIIRRSILQVLVEFETMEMAKKAKHAMNGADIYSGCCTLKVEFARPDYVKVTRNDSDQHDYTRPDLSSKALLPRKPLIPVGSREGGGPPAYHQREPNGYNDRGGGYDGGYHDRRGPPPGTYPPRDSYGAPPLGDGYRGGPSPSPRNDYHHRGGYEREYADFPPRGAPEYETRGGPPPHRGYERGYAERGAGGGYENGYTNGVREDYGPPMAVHHGGGSPVLMIYGITHKAINCAKLFNILCQYGNVERIKFMRKKTDTAMVEMGSPLQVTSALNHLQDMEIFGLQLQLRPSWQNEVREFGTPFEMPDGSPSYRDFAQSRNQRFTTPQMAMKNRICSPTSTLHFFNAPPSIDEEQIIELFRASGAPVPHKVVMSARGLGRSRAGTAQFNNIVEASEAMALAGHTPVESPDSPVPYLVKMAYFGPGKPRAGGPSEKKEEVYGNP